MPLCGRLVLPKRRGMFFATTSPVCMCGWQFDPPHPPRVRSLYHLEIGNQLFYNVALDYWRQACSWFFVASPSVYIFFLPVTTVECVQVLFLVSCLSFVRLSHLLLGLLPTENGREFEKKKQFFSRSEWAKPEIEGKKRSNRKSVIVFFGSPFFWFVWVVCCICFSFVSSSGGNCRMCPDVALSGHRFVCRHFVVSCVWKPMRVSQAIHSCVVKACPPPLSSGSSFWCHVCTSSIWCSVVVDSVAYLSLVCVLNVCCK